MASDVIHLAAVVLEECVTASGLALRNCLDLVVVETGCLASRTVHSAAVVQAAAAMVLGPQLRAVAEIGDEECEMG